MGKRKFKSTSRFTPHKQKLKQSPRVPSEANIVRKTLARSFRGSFHQGHPKYGENAGKQCLANCCAFLMKSTILRQSDYPSISIDKVLDVGDQLYSKILNSVYHGSPPSNGHLEADDLTGIHKAYNSKFHVRILNVYHGVINHVTEGALMALEDAVEEALAISNAAFFTCEGFGYALFRQRNGVISFFDSHSRTENGYSTENGTAVVLNFMCTKDWSDFFTTVGKKTFRTQLGSQTGIPIGYFQMQSVIVHDLCPQSNILAIVPGLGDGQLEKYFKRQARLRDTYSLKRKSLSSLPNTPDGKKGHTKRKLFAKKDSTYKPHKSRTPQKDKRYCRVRKEVRGGSELVLGLTMDDLRLVKKFHRNISIGCIFLCISCFRFLFKNQVKLLPQELPQKSVVRIEKCKELLMSLRTFNEKTHLMDYTCMPCLYALKKATMPEMCQLNQLFVPDAPQEIVRLCSLELHLITRLTSFMKVMIRIRGAQDCLVGPIVMVPSDINKLINTLPRVQDEVQTLTITLKRRLSDKHPYKQQTVSPENLKIALNILKKYNCNYKDIDINEHWSEIELSSEDIPQVDTGYHADLDPVQEDFIEIREEPSVVPENLENSNEPPDDDEEEINFLTGKGDENAVDIDELMARRALAIDTVLAPINGPSVDHHTQVNQAIYTEKDIGPGNSVDIAPGEGSRPMGFFTEKNWEGLTSPDLFWTGVNTFAKPQKPRKTVVREASYFKVRFMGAQMQFVTNPMYLFNCMNYKDTKRVNSTVSLATKKCSLRNVTVADLKDASRVKNLVNNNIIYTSFSGLRGTPQFWNEMKLDMNSKVRFLGRYTFFITMSAAEFYWPVVIKTIAHQYGEILTNEQVESMSWDDRRKWLQRNPCTGARMIDYILNQALGKVILSGNHFFGEVINHDTRSEFQQRGAVHFHLAIHVEGAPDFNTATNQEIINFIGNRITCTIPDKKQAPRLHKLVSTVQRHQCTSSCFKGGRKTCRFNYPRPITDQAYVRRHGQEEDTIALRQLAEKTLTDINNAIQRFQSAQHEFTLSELLDEASVSRKDYDKIMETALIKEEIILKRAPAERFINNYNPLLLHCLEANMDIQYICNIFSCIAYLTSYMCKPERTVGNAMQEVLKAESRSSTREKGRALGRIYLSHREVCSHEAITKLLSIPMKRTNRTVRWVNTNYSIDRPMIKKSQQVIELLDDDDITLFFEKTPIQYYEERPRCLEKLSLAEYMTEYYKVKTPAGTKVGEVYGENSMLPDKIITPDYTLNRRKQSAVLRYHYESPKRNRDGYFHRIVLLYLPFRSENELETADSSFEEIFVDFKDEILPRLEKYEKYTAAVGDATEKLCEEIESQNLMDTHAVLEECQGLAPINEADEEENDMCIEGGAEADFHALRRSSRNDAVVRLIPEWMPQEDYLNHMRNLNVEQGTLFRYIEDWMMKKCDNPETPAIYIFLSGEGGMGKSFLIESLYQTFLRKFNKAGMDPDSPVIIKMAYTGKAASHIGGNTIHSTLGFVIRKGENGELYIPPTGEKRTRLINMFKNLIAIIVDEASMVGGGCMEKMNRFFQDIFGNDKPFGGITVILVGDLMQLKPVKDSQVFMAPKNAPLHTEALLPTYFKMFELNTIVRQKGDMRFANLLSRLRVGALTKEDINLLIKRQGNVHDNVDSIKLFIENAPARKYNVEHLSRLETETITIDAVSFIADPEQQRRRRVEDTESNPHKTGNLPSRLVIARGARVLLTRNLDTRKYLVNGATGTVLDYEFLPNKPLVNGTIFVKFDNHRTGNGLEVTHGTRKGTIPIKACSTTYRYTEHHDIPRTYDCERFQFPLILAWALTAHKSQGSTYESVTCVFSPVEKWIESERRWNIRQVSCQPGQVYTMMSRVTSLQGLHLVDFHTKHIKANEEALKMMDYLRKNNKLCPKLHLQPIDGRQHIAFLNINGFPTHFEDFKASLAFHERNIYLFGETHISTNQGYDLPNMQKILVDTAHGLAAYLPEGIIIHGHRKNLFLGKVEELIVHFKLGTSDTQLHVVYIPPKTAVAIYREYFAYMSAQALMTKIIFMGDYNLDINSPLYKELLGTLPPDMKQYITGVTHNHGHTLDHIYSNIRFARTFVAPNHYSDHRFIYATV